LTIGEKVLGFRGWLDATGHTSNETSWSAELIYDHMLMIRADFIKQKMLLGLKIGYENYRIIPCVPLIKTDRNECPCIPTDGCSFKKTKWPILRHLDIKTVSTSKGEIEYDYVDWEKFESKLNHRMAPIAKSAYYTYKNTGNGNYHYLYNDIHKRFLTYTLIPYDPVEYALFPDCNGNVNHCLNPYEDVEFTVDAELEIKLFDVTYQSLIKTRTKEVDVFNNGIKDLGLPNK
jgi:hypothetical protein